jgi:hypothetical protein
MDYEAVIGLETHVQFKTQSKMWCGCANALGSPPSTNVCPVCLGLRACGRAGRAHGRCPAPDRVHRLAPQLHTRRNLPYRKAGPAICSPRNCRA